MTWSLYTPAPLKLSDIALPTPPLTGSVTVDPSTLTNTNGVATTTITVTGAALGDLVTGLSFSQNLGGLRISGYVSAANTVTVEFLNDTNAAVEIASGTLRAQVTKAT